MSHDVVALLATSPSRDALLQALLQAGPQLRMRLVAEGAIIELRDDSGRLVAAVQAAQRLALSAEADRLLTDGISDDLPAQPYWVEARGADLADVDTAGIARRFARALADDHGGLVWEPETRLDRGGALEGTTDHPAVTARTDTSFVVVQDRPLVSISPWLVDAIAAHGRVGRRLQLVTPSTSRITHALRSLLAAPASRWVVRAPDGGFYDGFFGVPLVWSAEEGFVVDSTARAEDGPHEEFRGSGRDLGSQLLIDLHVEHPAEDDLVLGSAAELLAETLGGSLPSLWGTSEPAPLAWDRDALTAACRRRVPGQTWTVFTGPPPAVRESGVRPFAGTLKVGRSAHGVRESITFAVGYEPGAEPDFDALAPLVEELTGRDVLRTMVVQRLAGRPDLTYAPRWSGAPAPVGMAVGVEGVSETGRDHALSAPVDGVPFGPPLTPAIWYRVGDGLEPDAWDRFRALMDHLRPKGAPAGR
ncbi:hypothetical protein DFP74_2563 [Nocardiopsis sp. Huas11]|uniref:DUF6177 family protein n=1 Tax=Nocardiopsis sp. Huas11 TaxID=2183912 RepID=UPI000EABA3C8|nr:DUF6177 family protein [Nocardiopsis sp. Huas11]RKS06913.1 hypothetical protein DFP74_2563 [Nocardiopsis sp. Huas11]